MIELLSPAKNADVGIVAVNHGADAVYIGAPAYGARAAAGCSVADIERLACYAHRFRARVYVALNTILTDAELPQAVRIAHQLYEAGADALIVQDMGLLETDLPPIALHASTQCDNRTVEKVKFLEQCGFSQIVLARELSLTQIAEIARQTTATIECFVHGALCVSYSGQCYLSQALFGRSANRGCCAQPCRLPYTLRDADGKILLRDKYLLSLKDFDASEHLQQLIQAGVGSLKIEGRLKDTNYVKNITAYYRRKLDQLFDGTAYHATSSGRVQFFFEPNPQKTFYRGTTDYFLMQRRSQMASFDTPKSMGEYVGKVQHVYAKSFDIINTVEIHNGDGLCFMLPNGKFTGCRINRVEKHTCFPVEMPPLTPNIRLYRNFDAAFNRLLAGEHTAERRIAMDIIVRQVNTDLIFEATDEDGTHTTVTLNNCDLEPAQQPAQAQQNLEKQLSKLGTTDFAIRHLQIDLQPMPFIPASVVTRCRRQLTDQLMQKRLISYKPERHTLQPTTHPFPQPLSDYRANVLNAAAERFYNRHGIKITQRAFEQQPQPNAELMCTRYCLRFALGLCREPVHNKQTLHEPLILSTDGHELQLEFNCEKCEMIVKQHNTITTQTTIN